MKKIIPLFFVLISCGNSSEMESEKNSLSEYMKSYIDAFNTKNHRAQLDFLPEDCLQGQSKDILAKQMESVEILDFLPKFYLDSYFEIDTILNLDNNFFARISNDLIIEHDLRQFNDTENSTQNLKFALEELENQYGKERVTYNETTLIASCKSETFVYAYSESGEEWLIFGITPCTEELIPNEIRK